MVVWCQGSVGYGNVVDMVAWSYGNVVDLVAWWVVVW